MRSTAFDCICGSKPDASIASFSFVYRPLMKSMADATNFFVESMNFSSSFSAALFSVVLLSASGCAVGSSLLDLSSVSASIVTGSFIVSFVGSWLLAASSLVLFFFSVESVMFSPFISFNIFKIRLCYSELLLASKKSKACFNFRLHRVYALIERSRNALVCVIMPR